MSSILLIPAWIIGRKSRFYFIEIFAPFWGVIVWAGINLLIEGEGRKSLANLGAEINIISFATITLGYLKAINFKFPLPPIMNRWIYFISITLIAAGLSFFMPTIIE